MSIKPLNKNVFVKVEKVKDVVQMGHIQFHIASTDDQRLEKAKVLSVSDEVKSVKKGDVIHFKAYSLSEIEIDRELFAFLKEDDILAKE